MSPLINFLRQQVRRFGFDVVKYGVPLNAGVYPLDYDQTVIEIIRKVLPFTQTSSERLFVLHEAVKYIVANKIPGDVVECGVWKGGSMMAIAHTLLWLNDHHRHLHLFDTFEGMPLPVELDVSVVGETATSLLEKSEREDLDSIWCYAPLDEVKVAVTSVGYNPDKIHFIKGKVEDTLPEYAPETIALLRLDTDWYESTRHELIHLFPRLSSGGVIIIDDYGHWQGAREAVDEYIRDNQIVLLLNRIDYTGRIGVKL